MSIGPEHYKSYGIVAPLRSHFRKATCAEVECEQYVNGWRVRLEGLPAEMVHTAKNSGRRWHEESVTEGETYLVYPAGQPCFRESQHRKRLERIEFFVVRDGDNRGNPRGTQPRTMNSDDWVDDFANHQDRIKTARERG